jgi:dihydropteroate synthase
MHMLGEPGNMQDNPHYQDVTGRWRVSCRAHGSMCGGGHSAERIILDPGFGFAKTCSTI